MWNSAFTLHLISLWCAGVVLVSSPARGEDETPIRAVMVLKPAADTTVDVTPILQGQVSDLPVALLVDVPATIPVPFDGLYAYFTALAQERGASVVFMADFDAADFTTLYISLPETGTTLVRHIDCTDESEAGRYEVVAVIVRGILAAMSTGGEIGVHIPTVEKPPEPPKEPIEEHPKDDVKAGAVFAARAAYGLGVASPDVPVVHNFRIGFSLELERFSIFTAYRIAMPISIEDDAVAMTLYPHPISVGAGFKMQIFRGTLLIGLEGVVDPVTWNVAPKEDRADATSGHRAVRGAISPMVGFDWNIASGIAFYAACSLDIHFYQPGFYLAENGAERPILSMWTLSPFFQLGFGFGLGG